MRARVLPIKKMCAMLTLSMAATFFYTSPEGTGVEASEKSFAIELISLNDLPIEKTDFKNLVSSLASDHAVNCGEKFGGQRCLNICVVQGGSESRETTLSIPINYFHEYTKSIQIHEGSYLGTCEDPISARSFDISQRQSSEPIS